MTTLTPGDRVTVREPKDIYEGRAGTIVRIASKEAGNYASGFSVLVDGDGFDQSRWYRPADLEKEQTG